MKKWNMTIEDKIDHEELIILYKAHCRKKRIFVLSMFMIIIVITLGAKFYLNSIDQSTKNKLELKINNNYYSYKDKTFYVPANQINEFDPYKCISSFNSYYKLTITIKNEEMFKRGISGSYDILFDFTSKQIKNRIKRTIIINDDICPVLVLSTDKIAINVSEMIDYLSYISSVSDNESELTLQDIKYDPIDTSKSGQYQIEFQVTDRANNMTSAVLTVDVIDFVISSDERLNNKVDEKPRNSIENKVIPRAKVTKVQERIFKLEDYSNIAVTEATAKQYGKDTCASGLANSWNCVPYSENGIVVGYKVTFE